MHRDLLSLVHKKLIPQSTKGSFIEPMKNFINLASISTYTLAMNANIEWKRLVLKLEKKVTKKIGDVYLVEAKIILDNEESVIEESDIDSYVKDHYIGLPYGDMLKTISWENYYYFLSILFKTLDTEKEFLEQLDDYQYIDPSSLWYPFIHDLNLDEMKFIDSVYPAIWNEGSKPTGLFKRILEDESGELFDFIYLRGDDRLKFEYNRDIIYYLINHNKFDVIDRYVKNFSAEMRKGFVDDIPDIYQLMASSRNMEKWLEWMKNNLYILPQEDVYFAIVNLYYERIVDNDIIISLFIWLKNNEVLPSYDMILISIEFDLSIIKWVSQNWYIPKKMRKQWYLFEYFGDPSEFDKIGELIKLGILAQPDNNILYNLDYYGKNDLLKYLKNKYSLTYVPSGEKMSSEELKNSKGVKVANLVWWPNEA